jgi:hypothetical protein
MGIRASGDDKERVVIIMARRTNETENALDLAGELAESAPEAPPIEPAPLEPAPQPTAARLVYVGPNVPDGVLRRFQVFKGGLPPYCEKLREKVPEITGLFVPVEGLEAARRKIEEPGTNEARLFQRVQRNLSKEVR